MLYCNYVLIKESFGQRNKYCICQDGYYGILCEKSFTPPELSPEELLFGIKCLRKCQKQIWELEGL